MVILDIMKDHETFQDSHPSLILKDTSLDISSCGSLQNFCNMGASEANLTDFFKTKSRTQKLLLNHQVFPCRVFELDEKFHVQYQYLSI